MQKLIRSRKGFEESDMRCPWCGHEHDLKVVEKLFVKSGNKLTMNLVCDDCDKTMQLQKHTQGHFTFYPYIDHKKRRLRKAGWVQQKFYAPIDYANEWAKR
jgi:transcription elongation factor Elf1